MSKLDEVEFMLIGAAAKYFNSNYIENYTDSNALFLRGVLDRLGRFDAAKKKMNFTAIPAIYHPLPCVEAPWPWRVYRMLGRKSYKVEASNGVLVARSIPQELAMAMFDRGRVNKKAGS